MALRVSPGIQGRRGRNGRLVQHKRSHSDGTMGALSSSGVCVCVFVHTHAHVCVCRGGCCLLESVQEGGGAGPSIAPSAGSAPFLPPLPANRKQLWQRTSNVSMFLSCRPCGFFHIPVVLPKNPRARLTSKAGCGAPHGTLSLPRSLSLPEGICFGGMSARLFCSSREALGRNQQEVGGRAGSPPESAVGFQTACPCSAGWNPRGSSVRQ